MLKHENQLAHDRINVQAISLPSGKVYFLVNIIYMRITRFKIHKYLDYLRDVNVNFSERPLNVYRKSRRLSLHYEFSELN